MAALHPYTFSCIFLSFHQIAMMSLQIQAQRVYCYRLGVLDEAIWGPWPTYFHPGPWAKDSVRVLERVTAVAA